MEEQENVTIGALARIAELERQHDDEMELLFNARDDALLAAEGAWGRLIVACAPRAAKVAHRTLWVRIGFWLRGKAGR